jgi:aspartyl-tRNA(Asn)/glutamyl-tRNA(Gln) amidotransferase subunit C
VRIDHAEVRRIARLAHLELDDAEVEALTRDLESILDHVALLDELDVSSVEPTAFALEVPAEPREDAPGVCVPSSEALVNAPDSADGHFRVPQVIDE